MKYFKWIDVEDVYPEMFKIVVFNQSGRLIKAFQFNGEVVTDSLWVNCHISEMDDGYWEQITEQQAFLELL